MNWNFAYNNINEAIPNLMENLVEYGETFDSRAGSTKELTFIGITLRNPWQREIVVPSRKANIAAQIVETMWVLSGRNDIAALLPYLPRAADFSDDGKTWRSGYGPRLRNYMGVDQLAYVVETLRANPSSRQAVCTIWDPTVDTEPGRDLACNNWLTFSCRGGVLDLMVGIRSNDAMWGWSGINAFEWSVVLEVVSGMTGLEMGQLHFAVTSFHLYEQHWEKAHKLAVEQLKDDYEDSPRFDINFEGRGLRDGIQELDHLLNWWLQLERAIRIGVPVGDQVDTFPEPMLRSWLRVLQWYWSGDTRYLDPIKGTRLDQACLVGLKPAGAPQELPDKVPYLTGADALLAHINDLHAEKHAAYGDSWKRRGEPGILGNIARKVDRIRMGTDTRDEAQSDTAQDLMVYLAKYHCWLSGMEGDPAQVATLLSQACVVDHSPDFNASLDRLFTMPAGTSTEKLILVNQMLDEAYSFALSLW